MSEIFPKPIAILIKAAILLLISAALLFSRSAHSAETIEFRHEGGAGLSELPGPHAITRIFKNGNTSPASVLFYDRNGLLTDVTGDMPLCHEFNVLGKLKRASSELRNNGSCTGATSISYLYTATGEKLAVLEHNNNKTNVFMGEVRFTNNIPRLSYGGDVETSEDGSSLNYYVRDHLGSVVATASPSQILEKRDHLPYGETWYHTQAGNEFSDQDFNGHYKQGSLLDYNARHYHPTLGKFIQPDSIVPKTDTVGFNRYAYVSNNPVNRVDPSGHSDSVFLSYGDAQSEGVTQFTDEILSGLKKNYGSSSFDWWKDADDWAAIRAKIGNARVLALDLGPNSTMDSRKIGALLTAISDSDLDTIVITNPEGARYANLFSDLGVPRVVATADNFPVREAKELYERLFSGLEGNFTRTKGHGGRMSGAEGSYEIMDDFYHETPNGRRLFNWQMNKRIESWQGTFHVWLPRAFRGVGKQLPALGFFLGAYGVGDALAAGNYGQAAAEAGGMFYDPVEWSYGLMKGFVDVDNQTGGMLSQSRRDERAAGMIPGKF